MIFEITREMKLRIKKWDSCYPVDVSGAKFAYTFIPTGVGLLVTVKCDVCDRELDLTEDL